MPNVKTTISIEKPIFDQIDAIARRRKLSRSRVFALAAEEFIQRHRNQELLEAINAAHSEEPDEEEKLLAEGMRKKHAQILQDRW